LPYVLPIHEVSPDLAGLAGRKCVQLGTLLSAGFRVPAGFCILFSGYEAFVNENSLQGKIERFVEQVAARDKPLVGRQESEILHIFQSAAFPGSLQEEILAAYGAFSHDGSPAPAVAVRSSGAQEDGTNASFAGQFESFLNVRGEQVLLDQIKRCWAGFWKARSLCYRMDRVGTNGFNGIAILVQKMVPARMAGVLFSANPISGSSDQMVIEASWGLGEAIVDGTVTPDRFVVDAANRKIIEQTIHHKKIMRILAPGKTGGTRRVRVPRDRQSIPCLTEKEIDTLVKTGSRVHQHFGRPQDIEWAYHENVLFILQARPITTLPVPEKAPPSHIVTGEPRSRPSEFDSATNPNTEWTSTTVRDMLPGALSPLTISQMNTLEYGFQKPQEELGLLPPFALGKEERFLGFFYNRAHLNMSLIRSLIRQVPLVSPDNLERILEAEPTQGRARPWSYIRFARDIPNMLRVGMHALDIVRRREPVALALLASGLREYAEEQKQGRIRSLGVQDLLQRMSDIQKKRAEIYAMHITASQFGEVTFGLLNRLIGRWTRDENGHLASQLVSGSSTALFAKPIAELWSLAQKVRATQGLERCFSSRSIHTVWRRLEADRSRSSRQFTDAFRTFLSQYGYRSRYGAELMRPSWDGEPIFILSIVKLYSRLLLTLNPWELEREQTQRRMDILRQLESHLNPVSKRVLSELLKLMQALIPLRQNMRALSLMQSHMSRQVARQMEQRLLEAGVLAGTDDVYFLTLEELDELLAGLSRPSPASSALSGEARTRVERRKRDFRHNQEVMLPEFFRGRPEPLCPFHPFGNRKEEKRLRGIPASPGRVTGQARRITAPLQEMQILPGEILILPGMDPGWTPLFPAASAIVAERGGILSHGSILAREFGIPAVTGIAHVTQIIHTGQVITVDGERGDVWL